MTEEWIETNNSACKILRQVHDMLALTSYPPRKAWSGLTDDEFDSIDPKISLFQFYKAIETKLKEKNG